MLKRQTLNSTANWREVYLGEPFHEVMESIRRREVNIDQWVILVSRDITPIWVERAQTQPTQGNIQIRVDQDGFVLTIQISPNSFEEETEIHDCCQITRYR